MRPSTLASGRLDFASEALPPAPPDLATWQSEFGLTLEGGDTVGYIVRAHIIDVSRCRNPSACS